MNGTWTVLDIHNRPADVYEPPSRPRFGVLYLHGQDQESLRDQPTLTRLLQAESFACVCPQGGASWWTDRVCTPFHPEKSAERILLDDVLPLFRQRWNLAPRSVGLLGYDMGGQGALRLAFKYPNHFPAVAAVAPALEYHELYDRGTPLDDMYDSKEQCRQDTAGLHVSPLQSPSHVFFCIDPDDPWYRGADRLHEKLSALGIAHESDLTTRAGGHSLAYFERMADRAVRFLRDGLELESRRLL